MVEINQQPFWYGGTAQNPEALEWTWIDLLHHLGKNWLDIITEAPWPNERLAAAMQEGKDFWALAEDDWSDMSPDAADHEEAQMLAFVRPRNLAHALQGLALPALYCYRQGKDMQLCPEGMPPLRMPGIVFVQMLEKLGEQIDQGLGHTTHARAQQAQNAWRNRNPQALQQLDALATALSHAPAPTGKPHEQGYQLAQLLRQHYRVSDSAPFPITQVIEQLKLPMCSTNFDCPQLQAIAIWGHRGPAILLNADKDANTGASHVRRILLAHELCHLLFDRQHAQPAADVLGANTTSTHTEQRAKAFAAELLLPRDSAAKAYAQHPTLRDTITSLSKTFDVSPQVAKTQILNSGMVNTDDEDDIRAQLRQDRFPG
jgi:Zn-dependent peptidase ImmA (M78 family)